MTLGASRQAGRLARLACLSLAALLLARTPAAAQGAASWDLKVCADPDNLPYSDRDRQGFENRVIDVLADELGAEVSYAWLPLPRREGQGELMLRMGACDVLASV